MPLPGKKFRLKFSTVVLVAYKLSMDKIYMIRTKFGVLPAKSRHRCHEVWPNVHSYGLQSFKVLSNDITFDLNRLQGPPKHPHPFQPANDTQCTCCLANNEMESETCHCQPYCRPALDQRKRILSWSSYLMAATLFLL